MLRALNILLVLLIFFTAHSASAQLIGSNFTSNSSSAEISISPAFPDPYTTINVSLSDYSINTQGAQYRWYINNTEDTSLANQRSFSLGVGNIGETTTITVLTTLASGATYTISKNVTPYRVDLLVEANTLAPHFYKGRHLPSSGSYVRVVAIPFTTSNSSTPNTYSYLWKVDGEVVNGGSQYGKNSVSFRSNFERAVEVSVDIFDQDGTLLASKTSTIGIVDPEIHFYEVNPLSGIQETAMTRNYILSGEEITVRAEPYFMDNTIMANTPYTEWKLNNTTVNNPSEDQQEIILRRSGSSGTFTLTYHVRNLNQLLQGAKESVTVSF